MIKHIKNNEEFKEIIKEGKVLVDFFATWCGPCKMIAPELEELDNQQLVPNLKIIKVDVDELGSLAAEYRIRSIPTLMLFENGELKKTTLGYQNKNQLVDFAK